MSGGLVPQNPPYFFFLRPSRAFPAERDILFSFVPNRNFVLRQPVQIFAQRTVGAGSPRLEEDFHFSPETFPLRTCKFFRKCFLFRGLAGSQLVVGFFTSFCAFFKENDGPP